MTREKKKRKRADYVSYTTANKIASFTGLRSNVLDEPCQYYELVSLSRPHVVVESCCLGHPKLHSLVNASESACIACFPNFRTVCVPCQGIKLLSSLAATCSALVRQCCELRIDGLFRVLSFRCDTRIAGCCCAGDPFAIRSQHGLGSWFVILVDTIAPTRHGRALHI